MDGSYLGWDRDMEMYSVPDRNVPQKEVARPLPLSLLPDVQIPRIAGT